MERFSYQFAILFSILLIISFASTAQNSENKDEYYVGYNFLKDPITRGRVVLCLSYNGIKYSYGEIGVGIGYRGNEGYGYVYSQYSLNCEASKINNKLIIAPKLSYSTSFAFIYIGANILFYTDFSNQEYCFRPEIGPTFAGGLSLCYGYNINFNDRILPINYHNLSLKLIIGKACWKNIF